MTRDDLLNGDPREASIQSYKLVNAMDEIRPPTPAMKIQALAFLTAMVADLMDYEPHLMLELGDNIRREMSKHEPDTLKAFRAYVAGELR
jgi:hypothetical protein